MPTGGYWDAQLQTLCTIVKTGPKQWRCLPTGAISLFADGGCVVPVALTYGLGDDDDSRYARLNNSEGEDLTHVNVSLLEDANVLTLYHGTPESCVEHQTSIASLLAMGYDPPRYIGSPASDSLFVEIFYTHE